MGENIMGQNGPSIFNPTGWTIEGGYNGNEFKFKAGEEREIWDVNVIRHLSRVRGYLGLVHLVYNEQMQAKYDTYADFYKAQVLDGLGQIRKTVKGWLLMEKQALSDLHAQKGSSFDADMMGTARFEKKLKEIDAWEKEYKTLWAKQEEKNDGQIDNKNKRKAKAG